MQKRDHWNTQIGVILAVTGSAVGLGNFLRFPGQAAMHGGGPFMITYIIAFFLLGVPLAWVEWAIGRYGGTKGHNSVPGIMRTLTKSNFGAYFGVLGVAMPTIIFMYYIIIEAWCLQYAIGYLTGSISLQGSEPIEAIAASKAYFAQMAGLNADGEIFANGLFSKSFFLIILCFGVNYFLIFRGVSKGIEKFCRVAMPALIICALIMMVRVVTLGNPTGIEGQGFIDGLGYVFNPAPEGKTIIEGLQNPGVWLASSGHIFFSLSLGFGLIMTYASYTRNSDDIALSSLTACAGNGFCEAVLAAIIIVPAAFMFLGPAFIQNQDMLGTFSVGFYALPCVFAQMPAGWFFGFLFFGLLFLAAVTSSISELQPAIATLEESLQIKRHGSVTILALLTFLGAMFVAYFSKGLTALDTLDFWMANVLIFFLAIFQTLAFGWWFGIDKGLSELEKGSKMKLPRILKFVIKYVSPTYLILVCCAWVYTKGPENLEKIKGDVVIQFAIAFIAIVFIFFWSVTWIGVKAWEKREKIESELDSNEV